MDLNSKNIKKIMLLIVFAAIIFWCGQYFPSIIKGSVYVLSIFTPLIVGFCIAFVLNVLMRGIENKWDHFIKEPTDLSNKLKRPISLILTFLLVFIFLFILFFLIVPEITKSISSFAEMLPTYMTHLEENINNFIEKNQLSFVNIQELDVDWQKLTSSIGDFVSEGGKSFFSTTIDVTSSIFSGFVSLILGLVFSIYMLLQKEKFGSQAKRILYAFLDKEKVDNILRVGTISNRIFSSFVTGQLLEAVIIGVLCFIGMTILGMPYAVMISSLVGFTALIPIVGAFIGTAVGALLIFIISPIKALWFVIFIIVLQQFEGNLIYPKVVGKSVGLPGIWVLAAVTIAGSLGGIVAMLISVPVSSILYYLLREEVNYRLKKKGIKKNADLQTSSDLKS